MAILNRQAKAIKHVLEQNGISLEELLSHSAEIADITNADATAMDEEANTNIRCAHQNYAEAVNSAASVRNSIISQASAKKAEAAKLKNEALATTNYLKAIKI